MSRWIDTFKNNQFQNVWAQLLVALDEVAVDETTPIDSVKEISRIKKILTLIDQIIINVDPELIPVTAYSQWFPQAQACLQQVQAYKGNKNIGHLSNANSNADSLFAQVRPYMLVPEQALDAFSVAVDAYTESVTKYIQTFEQSAKRVQSALSVANGEAVAQKKRFDEIEARVRRFDDYLFLDVEQNGTTENRVKAMVEKVAADHKAVTELHEKLFSGHNSTSQVIAGYDRDIKNLLAKIGDLADAAESEHSELKKFYHRIFGENIEGGEGNDKKGLKVELDERLEQLNKYEDDQKKRHGAIYDEVERLIPGATTASLATAYKNLKDSFNKPIDNYTKAFYGSLIFLLLSGLLMIFDFSYEPFSFALVKANEWHEMLRTLLVRAPVVIPVVWFAVFSATRRSQYERLQQEYAHKEALALSYQSYKQQLQDLQVDAEELQKELIAKSIDAISYNASRTLDGKHTEKPPVFQLLEKLNVDDLKKIVDFAKEKIVVDQKK